MGRIQEVGWVVVGLVIWVGICYYIYRLIKGRVQSVRRFVRNGFRVKMEIVVGVQNQILVVSEVMIKIEIEIRFKFKFGVEIGEGGGVGFEVGIKVIVKVRFKVRFQVEVMVGVEIEI